MRNEGRRILWPPVCARQPAPAQQEADHPSVPGQRSRGDAASERQGPGPRLGAHCPEAGTVLTSTGVPGGDGLRHTGEELVWDKHWLL